MDPQPRTLDSLKYTSAGMEFILTAATVAVVGWLLGRWLGWPVAGGIAGGLAGFGIGLWRLVRTALAWQKQYDAGLRHRRGPGNQEQT